MDQPDPRMTELLAHIAAGAVTHEALADLFMEFAELARDHTRDQVLERLRRNYPTQAELAIFLQRSAFRYMLLAAAVPGVTPLRSQQH